MVGIKQQWFYIYPNYRSPQLTPKIITRLIEKEDVKSKEENAGTQNFLIETPMFSRSLYREGLKTRDCLVKVM